MLLINFINYIATGWSLLGFSPHMWLSASVPHTQFEDAESCTALDAW